MYRPVLILLLILSNPPSGTWRRTYISSNHKHLVTVYPIFRCIKCEVDITINKRTLDNLITDICTTVEISLSIGISPIILSISITTIMLLTAACINSFFKRHTFPVGSHLTHKPHRGIPFSYIITVTAETHQSAYLDIKRTKEKHLIIG